MISIRRFRRVAAFLACLTPAVWLVGLAFTGNLSANPIQDITQQTGMWTLRLIVITLCVTPLRAMTGWNEVVRYRRMLGLFAFFYGFLHFLAYVSLDQFFALTDIAQDVYKPPFIATGFSSFVLMIPLAITSTKKWVSRLGGRKWQLLHRLTYVSAIAGAAHYLWLVKADTARPMAYAFLLSILLGVRVLKLLPLVERHPWLVQQRPLCDDLHQTIRRFSMKTSIRFHRNSAPHHEPCGRHNTGRLPDDQCQHIAPINRRDSSRGRFACSSPLRGAERSTSRTPPSS